MSDLFNTPIPNLEETEGLTKDQEMFWKILKLSTANDWLHEFLIVANYMIRVETVDGYFRLCQNNSIGLNQEPSTEVKRIKELFHTYLSYHFDLVNEPDFIIDPNTFEPYCRMNIRRKT